MRSWIKEVKIVNNSWRNSFNVRGQKHCILDTGCSLHTPMLTCSLYLKHAPQSLEGWVNANSFWSFWVQTFCYTSKMHLLQTALRKSWIVSMLKSYHYRIKKTTTILPKLQTRDWISLLHPIITHIRYKWVSNKEYKVFIPEDLKNK